MTPKIIHSHVGSNGVLKVEVQTDICNTEVEAVVIVLPIAKVPSSSEHEGWPDDFFDKTFGCTKTAPLNRLPQDNLQERTAIH